MPHAVHVISDGDGLLVIGDPTAVEAFTGSQGLQSREIDMPRLHSVIASGAASLRAGADISATSGRWIKLTRESAEKVKTFGLMETKTPGVSHAMLGEPGKVKGWLRIVGGPGGKVASPAVLSGIAGVMTQLAMQQAMNDVTNYLAMIDQKLDDVLRAQKDFVLADMIGVELIIDEAMTVREHVGHVSEVTWSKVQSTHQTVATTQAYALRQIDGLATKLEGRSRVSTLAEASEEAAGKVQDWLAVLARCFQLQDAAAILELDRVMDSATNELDLHRTGLLASRQQRINLIASATGRLLQRLDAAADRANSRVLWNPAQSPTVVRSSNTVAKRVAELDQRLGIERGRDDLTARRWVEAAEDARDRAFERGADGVSQARRRGGLAAAKVKNARGRVSERISDRRREAGD